MHRWGPIAVCLLLGAAGCGGTGGSSVGGGGGGGPPDPPDPPGPPPGNVAVTITARDVLGSPVSGAEITLLTFSTGSVELDVVTDADGRAQVTGRFEDVYAAVVTATDLWGITYWLDGPVDERLESELTLHPSSSLASGIGRVSVTGSSADGRQLEFGARLYVIEETFAQASFEDWNIGAVGVRPCVPDTGNDAPVFVADCVQDSAGIDALYDGSILTLNWVDPVPASDPLAVALLMDEGASVAETDTADQRLLAAKYLQTQLKAEDQVVLAAFAADNAGTGQMALLPSQPVTIFPTDDPAYTTDGRSYFPTIDALATLEGGASPLHAAVDEMIGFAASHAAAESRRAVVALASGISDCGSPADCKATEEALRQQSASTGVAVVAVGLSGPSGQVDRKQLGMFAQGEQGAVFWARDATQVPTIFGRIPEILDGRHGAIDLTVRLQSSITGTFASGNIVMGTLDVVICPWDCTESIDVPFALRVP